jgi:serine O-acetyltransferase
MMTTLQSLLPGVCLPGIDHPVAAAVSEGRTDRVEAAHVPGSPAAVERLWQRIRQAANGVAGRERMLLTMLRRLVLSRASLADAMAAMLAPRLAGDHMEPSSLQVLMRGIFEDEAAVLGAVARDLQALVERDPVCADPLHGFLHLKGFHALQGHRVAHELWRRGRRDLALALQNRASLVFGVDIHPAARIGAGVMLDHGSGIVVGETAVIEDNVSILQDVTLGATGKERGDRHPKVRCGVMIGAGAKILGNIEIGAMSQVAAGSVVLQSVPPHCTVAGVPSRIMRLHEPLRPQALELDPSVPELP